MNLYTKYNRPPYKGEINNGKSLVEVAGYISSNKRIEMIMAAGERLIEYRKEQFDYEPDFKGEEELDPTRNPGFDMADAHEASEQVMENMNRQIELNKENAKKVAKEKKDKADAELKEKHRQEFEEEKRKETKS